MYGMNGNKIKNSGNILFYTGTASVVAAIATAALGTGGLQYMGVNPEALQLVAGCALLSAVLVSVGVLLTCAGLRVRADTLAEGLEDLSHRIERHEDNTDHYNVVDGIVKSHERLETEQRIDKLVDMISDRVARTEARLEHDGREGGSITRQGSVRRGDA